MRISPSLLWVLSFSFVCGIGSLACSGSGAGTGAGTGGTGTGGLADGQCHRDSECSKNYPHCVAPGHFLGGGGSCGDPNCSKDMDCAAKGPAWICEKCLGALQCKPGCTMDTQCKPAEMCGADHRCALKPCAADGSCPPQLSCNADKQCQPFQCQMDSDCEIDDICLPNRLCGAQVCAADADCRSNFHCDAKVCVRDACMDDSTCTGYCVDGMCYSTPGTCKQMPV